LPQLVVLKDFLILSFFLYFSAKKGQQKKKRDEKRGELYQIKEKRILDGKLNYKIGYKEI
jgi:hypothetical protein